VAGQSRCHLQDITGWRGDVWQVGGKAREFVHVGRHDRVGEKIDGPGPRRRGVDYEFAACGGGGVGGRPQRSRRYLEGQYDHVGGREAQLGQRLLDVAGGDQRVGAWRYRDLILAGVIDEDDCAAGRLGEALDAAYVHALGGEGGERLGAVGCAYSRDKVRSRTDARSRHGLIGALPALDSAQLAAEHRLTRRRQLRDTHDQVDVDRPDNDDPSGLVAHRYDDGAAGSE
jgi:hypothetical protein